MCLPAAILRPLPSGLDVLNFQFVRIAQIEFIEVVKTYINLLELCNVAEVKFRKVAVNNLKNPETFV